MLTPDQPSANAPRPPDVILRAIESFAELKQNWDSYGAPPIGEGAIAAAKRLWVGPTCRGGVGFEWDGEGGETFIFELAYDGSVEGFYVNANGNEFEWEKA